MPQAMKIDGSGEVDHSKPVAPSRNDYGSTNIETLSNQLQKFIVSHMAKEKKRRRHQNTLIPQSCSTSNASLRDLKLDQTLELAVV
ncbi:unnamed protein product [Phytophthora fragariaefolia]|uniref:Unnamed protein product n=1 Tax=Phytophthora fragariaefolia TaxID=1490495 RepID=A0A9W6UA61_9STRA|nr:unnamed protein product [Phytophthora fragariaefolia]